MITSTAAGKNTRIKATGEVTSQAMAYPPPMVSRPSSTSSQRVRGSRSPFWPWYSSWMGSARRTRRRLSSSDSTSTPMSHSVQKTSAGAETVKPRGTGIWISLSNTRNASLPSPSPAARPSTSIARPLNSISNTSTRAMWRFSIPSTAYRPNSLRRWRWMNELMYSMKMTPKTITTPRPMAMSILTQ